MSSLIRTLLIALVLRFIYSILSESNTCASGHYFKFENPVLTVML